MFWAIPALCADRHVQRISTIKDSGTLFPRDRARKMTSPEDRSAIEAALRNDFDAGALGLGISLSTVFPPTTPEEVLNLFHLAAERQRPVFVHLRDGDPYQILQEVIADAAISGASLHIEHVNTFLRNTPTALPIIDAARAHGIDVTTEALAYTAASMFMDSAAFEPGWQQRLRVSYSDLLWPVTGERLTA